MPKIELLERDGLTARYIVRDDDGRELRQTHRDVSKALEVARRRKINFLDVLAAEEGIVLTPLPKIAVIPVKADAPVASDHTHEEFSYPEPDRSHEHEEISSRLLKIEALLGTVTSRLLEVEMALELAKHSGHPHTHTDEFDELRGLLQLQSHKTADGAQQIRTLSELLEDHLARGQHSHDHESVETRLGWLAEQAKIVQAQAHEHTADPDHEHTAIEGLLARMQSVEGTLPPQLPTRLDLVERHTHPRHVHGKDEWPEHDHPEVEHGHHWLLVSEEDTAGKHRRIYKCRDCGRVETHQDP